MQELYDMSLGLHKFFVGVAFVISVVHLLLTQFGGGNAENTEENRAKNSAYVKRIRLILPLYYSVLAVIFTTGAVILPVIGFSLSFSVILMLVALVVMIGIGAMGYKKLKRAFFSKDFATYKRKMRILLGLNLAIILIVSFI